MMNMGVNILIALKDISLKQNNVLQNFLRVKVWNMAKYHKELGNKCVLSSFLHYC